MDKNFESELRRERREEIYRDADRVGCFNCDRTATRRLVVAGVVYDVCSVSCFEEYLEGK